MKTVIKLVVLALALFWAGVHFTGCAKPGATPATPEAVAFNTFADTWSVAHAAYKAHCEKVVQGKISTAKEVEMDALWNGFRTTFKAAFVAASQNWTAPAPAEVRQLGSGITGFK